MSVLKLAAYRGYTATAIKLRAVIPGQSDMTVNGTDVDCLAISVSKVRTALGSSAWDLQGLAGIEGVNVWSGFGPVHRSVSSLALVNSIEAPYSLGGWAGYNPDAVEPGWQTGGLAAASADVWIDSGGYASVTASVNVGEVRWSNDLSVVGLCLALYNSVGNLVGWGAKNFETDSIQNECQVTATVSMGYTGGMVIDETLTCKLWLVDDTSQFDDTQQQCYLPNTSSWVVDVKIRQATDLTVDDTGSFTIVSPSFNLSTGYVGFTDAYKNADYTNLRITAELFDENWEQVGSTVDVYNDEYTANTQLGALSAKPNGDPVAAYGRHFKLTFLYTI